MMKHLLFLLTISFLAYVKIPMGLEKRYQVDSFTVIHDSIYVLRLTSGEVVYVPIQFTVIEEKR
jgi:hypothetical protein